MTAIDLTPAETDHPLSVITNRSAEVITLWGSAGSGKSVLAINLAFELASQSQRTLLVDLDSRRPSLAAYLGLTDAGPGITAITRLARQNRLDQSELERLSAELKFQSHRLEVVTGMNSKSRWPELDSEGLEGFLALAKSQYDYVVFDVNDEMEEGLVSTRSISDRNFATRWAVENCDHLLAIFSAEPLGVNRFLSDVRDYQGEYWAIANFVSQASLGRKPERQIRQVLHQTARLNPRAFLPVDYQAIQWQFLTGKPLLLSPKSTKLGNAIHTLALDLMDARSSRVNSNP